MKTIKKMLVGIVGFFKKIFSGMALKKIWKATGKFILLVLFVTVVLSVWGTVRTPVERPTQVNLINDITQLNPILVEKVITPVTTEEIIEAVKNHKGPISVGGGRYSMGGQTATDQALQIDMRKFNKVIAFSTSTKTITVQTGIRWYNIQEYIDPYNLSVKIMQTYANFTVGGSLSVNAHGRYIGYGPLIYSVKSLLVVLPNGTLVEASRTKNSDIFYGVIGGYGGLGVITEATLELADNVRVERQDETMPASTYKDYFLKNIRDSKSVIFHNGDIYPDNYETVHAVSYVETDKSVTVTGRLIPKGEEYGLNRFAYWVISEWPFGKKIRQYIMDPLLFRGDIVTWRNYEASYDAMELEPASRERKTYVLQEMFVPVENFDAFVPKMREVFEKNNVNIINVSIRHAKEDPGSILAWARKEVFAFVIYYKQGTDADARASVNVWTREIIDAVLAVGGTYYLPYQPHATDEQFLKAYPRAEEFFALKKHLDPENKFRNKLWDKYYTPRVSKGTVTSDDIKKKLSAMPGYLRDGGQTFLTHPEWTTVYISDEYAAYLKDHLATSFPYTASIGGFWTNYHQAWKLTRGEYPMNWGYHVMLMVIGTSTSIEYSLKSVYENTIGRITGWLASGQMTEEDRYAYKMADDYAKFIHIYPWYEYDFLSKLTGLWSEAPLWGDNMIRKWERKVILSVEYGFKSAYGKLIKVATRAAYTPQDDKMLMVITGWNDNLVVLDSRIKFVEKLDDAHTLVALPRYDIFRDILHGVARSEYGALEIQEIAGNKEILVTGVARSEWQYQGSFARVVYATPIPSDLEKKRLALRVPVKYLLSFLKEVQKTGEITIDHTYDY